jgi:hypothetical protein
MGTATRSLGGGGNFLGSENGGQPGEPMPQPERLDFVSIRVPINIGSGNSTESH